MLRVEPGPATAHSAVLWHVALVSHLLPSRGGAGASDRLSRVNESIGHLGLMGCGLIKP